MTTGNMEVVEVVDDNVVAFWMLDCFAKTGRGGEVDATRLHDYIAAIRASGATFIEIPGHGFCGMMLDPFPYVKKQVVAFSLVSDGPQTLIRLLNAVEERGRAMGAEECKMEAATENLLQFYERRYVCRRDSFGSVIAERRR